MKAYFITGPSGTGKSTVYRELLRRGYYAIESDFEPELSGWINKESGQKAPHPSGTLSKEFLHQYEWKWDSSILAKLLQSPEHEIKFLCGGAHNQNEFFDLFTLRFELIADNQTLIKRLQSREPKRWVADSVELVQNLAWNINPKRFTDGGIAIQTNRPIEAVVDEILSYVNKH